MGDECGKMDIGVTASEIWRHIAGAKRVMARGEMCCTIY
jgi:hypothetical protein